MVWGGVAVEKLPLFVAGGALLALAGWLLSLNPRNRINRAFAVVLVMQGLLVGILGFSVGPLDPAGRVRVHALLAIPFAFLYFAHRYRGHRPLPDAEQGQRLGWVLPAGLLLAALSVQVLYAGDPALFFGPEGPGPLSLFLPGAYVAFALVSWIFVRAYARSPRATGSEGLRLAGLGVALEPAYQATQVLVDELLGALAGNAAPAALFSDALGAADRYLWIVTLLIIASVASRVVSLRSHGTPAVAAGADRFLLVLLAPLVSGLAVGVIGSELVASPATWYPRIHFPMTALWALATPALVTYALVRDQLFGIDVKVRWTIKQGTVAAFYVTVFFIVSEGAQELFQSQWGPLLGVLAAGGLVFALHPLQRFGGRLAKRVIPPERAGSTSGSRAAEVYRGQAHFAWSDGRLDPTERQMLVDLRERLALSRDEAMRIEEEIAEQLDQVEGSAR